MQPDVTDQELLERWTQGDESAAEQIFERYSRRTWKLAETLIAQRLKPRFDGEDVVQSVFRTFLRHSREGSYHVEAAESLWKLLSAIARNKISERVAFHAAQRRAVGRERSLGSSNGDSNSGELLAAIQPRVEDALALVEEVTATLAAFDPWARQVFEHCLEGNSTSEIAELMGCSRWSVRRTLDAIGVAIEARLKTTESRQ